MAVLALSVSALALHTDKLQLGVAGSPVVARNEPGGGTLENRLVAAEWKLHKGHLAGLRIVRRSTEASEKSAILRLDGSFTIELQDASVLPASVLEIQGGARVEQLQANPKASRYSDRLAGIAVHLPLADPTGRSQADWALVLREDSQYIRQVLTITANGQPLPLSGILMIDVRSAGIAVAGTVKGSPLVAGEFFLGFESPLAESSVVGERGVSELHQSVPIGAGHSAQYSAVIGVAPAGQMRRGFLSYLERERAHPYRTFLHYNSWFDIGYLTPYTQHGCTGTDRRHRRRAEQKTRRDSGFISL